jgi:hypothetical protein
MTTRVGRASSIQRNSPVPLIVSFEHAKDPPPVLEPPSPERSCLVLLFALVFLCFPLLLVVPASFSSPPCGVFTRM